MARNRNRNTTKVQDEVINTEAAPEVQTEQERPAVRNRVPVSHNPALIEWPTDLWGMCKDFRAAVTALGQRCGGAEDKRELVLAHLKVAVLYLEAKYEVEKALRDAAIAKVAAEAEAAEGEANAE